MEKKENKYMDLLNIQNEIQVHEEIKKMSSNLSDKEHLIRSSILEMHAAVEIELRRIFYHTFYSHLFLTNDEKQNEKTIKNFEISISKLGFIEMWRILKTTMIPWYQDFESIEDINTVRNQVTHADISKVNYKNRNPFLNPDCLAQIYFDVWAIKQVIPKYFWSTIKRPKVQLERYVKKYGDGEL
jgi:hypothetical protein